MTFPTGNPGLEKVLCGGLISDGVIRTLVSCRSRPIRDQESSHLTNEAAGNSSPIVMISMVVASLAQARHSGSVSYQQQQQRCNNSHGG